MSTMDEALEWLMRSREGDLTQSQRQQLADWLADSPAHVRGYLRAGELWVTLNAVDLQAAGPKEKLLELIRDKDHRANVFAFNSPGSAGASTGDRTSPITIPRKRWKKMSALAASLLAVAVGAWLYIVQANVYKTARGEQRSIVLSDGSFVQLNTLSKLSIHMDSHRRLIELKQGEAYFKVAPDPKRPFEVSTRDARVRALGTAFDVYDQGHSTHVAVIEGRVAVHRAAAPAMSLQAGQQVSISPAVRMTATQTTSQNVTAWMQRRIVLNHDTVADAAGEFNRYNRVQIRIDGEAVASLRINGVFDADDPRALVRFLQEAQGIKVQDGPGEIILRP